jgi:beta-glucanase (GH16 family)
MAEGTLPCCPLSCARVLLAAVLSPLLAASSLLVLSSGSVSAASSGAPAPSDANCQNTQPLSMQGAWSCTFDDEFNGTSLDTTKWTPQLTANSGYTTGTAAGWPCYVDNPSTISESGGYLDLSVVQEPAPVSCADGYSTPFEAGMVSTYGKFNQTYGAFEVNAELPASVAKGLQETFWLYPQTLTYGAWPHSGETDFAEFYSQYPTLDVPYIHYTEAASGDPNVTAYNCTINQGQFNTYGMDWQPGTLTIYLNGNVCLVDHPNPAAPLASPEPFNDPFFLALTQALGSGTDAYVPGATQLPATTLIDWVRAWTANTNTYAVTYSDNGLSGGSPPVDTSSPYGYGSTVNVLGAGTLTRTGYSFDDWNTAADGTGTPYGPGATFSMPAAGVTLYAIWTANTYAVTYNGNGSSGGSAPVDNSSPYDFGATVSVLGNTGDLVNTGHSFDDWNTAADGSGSSYGPGATFSMPAAGVTLYAIWTTNTLLEKTTTGLSLSKTSVTYGAETSETFTVTVTGQSGDGYPEGTTTVYNSSTKLCSQTLVEKSTNSATGTCSLTAIELPAGSYSDVFATYTPNTTSSSRTGYVYTASTSTPATRLSVTNDTTTTKVSESPTNVTHGDESAAVFTVTVTTHNGEAVPNGNVVTVKVSTATCTVTLNAGTGTCTIANSALPIGSYSVSATYAGSANLGRSSGTSATRLTVKS